MKAAIYPLKALRTVALHLEDGVQPDEELVQDKAAAMHSFLQFHQANEVVFENGQTTAEPAADFGRKLAAAL